MLHYVLLCRCFHRLVIEFVRQDTVTLQFNAEQRELLDQFEADDVLLNDFNRRATDAASQIEVAAKVNKKY